MPSVNKNVKRWNVVFSKMELAYDPVHGNHFNAHRRQCRRHGRDPGSAPPGTVGSDRRPRRGVHPAGARRGNRYAQAHTASHAPAARRSGLAPTRGRRPLLRHGRAPASAGRTAATQRHCSWRPPRGVAPAGRRARRELQHHLAIRRRGCLPRPCRDRGAAALLSAPGFACAGALFGQRQALPGRDGACTAASVAGPRTPRGLHAAHRDRPGCPRRGTQARTTRRLRAGQRGVPARLAVRSSTGSGTRGKAIQPVCRGAGAGGAAPVVRLTADKVLQLLPALQRAAAALAAIEDENAEAPADSARPAFSSASAPARSAP